MNILHKPIEETHPKIHSDLCHAGFSGIQWKVYTDNVALNEPSLDLESLK